MLLERQHAEHGGVAGRADRHGLAGAERRRQLNELITLQTGKLRQEAPARFTQAPAVVHKTIARLPARVAGLRDHAGAVYSRDHGPGAHHRSAVGDGQAVLVIEAGVLNAAAHVAGRQLRLVQLGHARSETSLCLVEQQSFEHHVCPLWWVAPELNSSGTDL